MVEWATLLPAALVISAVPGPSQVLAMRNGMRAGARPAIIASVGRIVAFALMIAVVALGLGTLLTTSEVVFQVVKWIGVAYLAWLGLSSFLEGRRSGASEVEEDVGPRRPTARELGRQEFVVAMANPKAIVLFSVILPEFVDRGGSPVVALMVAGLAFIAIDFVCAALYALVGSRVGALSRTPRARRIVGTGTGLSMLGVAGWLATQDR